MDSSEDRRDSPTSEGLGRKRLFSALRIVAIGMVLGWAAVAVQFDGARFIPLSNNNATAIPQPLSPSHEEIALASDVQPIRLIQHTTTNEPSAPVAGGTLSLPGFVKDAIGIAVSASGDASPAGERRAEEEATPPKEIGRLPHVEREREQPHPAARAAPLPSRHVIPLAGATPSPNVSVKAEGDGVSLVVRDGSLAEVLTLLAQTQGLNLVLAAPADARITVTLDRLPLEQALDSILAAGGYNWTRRGGVIFVTAMGAGGNVSPTIQGRRLDVFELDYASAADVDLAVKGLLSPVGKSWLSQSSITDNRRTKETIVVEDVPFYIDRIADYISQIDQPPRQVMIQVHVLQVDLKNEQRHGVNFEHLAKFAGTELNFKTTGFANSAAPQAFFLELDSPNLTALVEALKNSTDTKTLASPRVLALNGQQSRLQVGQQLGFRVTTTTQTSTLESVQFLDVGVVLPHRPRWPSDDAHQA